MSTQSTHSNTKHLVVDDTRKKRREQDANKKGNSNNWKPESTTKKIIPNTSPASRSAEPEINHEWWDLETALHQVVVTGSDERELVSTNRWITFRVGHAGDASAIASLYRATTARTESCGESGDSKSLTKTAEDTDALELRIANGLGDEDTPPALFAILVDVWDSNPDDTNSQQLGGVALLTLDWFMFNNRVLRLEWFHVDKSLKEFDLIKRRLWFRLSALAVVTACELLLPAANSETQTVPKNSSESDNQISPQATT